MDRGVQHTEEEMGLNPGLKPDFERAEDLDQKGWGKKGVSGWVGIVWQNCGGIWR